jgi:sugar/nucleoside kinase (ribokinase family)
LGAKTELLSMLGPDRIGDQILQELQHENVATEQVVRIPGGASPLSFIHVNEQSGERTIFHRSATGLTWPGDAGVGIMHCNALLIDYYYPDLAQAAATEARKLGIPVVADTVPSEANQAWLRNVDVLIAPHHFVRNGSFGDADSPTALDAALDAIHAMGPSTALITLGADGWVASDGAGRWRGAAFQVDVVDTVGAGDVFHGAFAFGLAHRWSTPRCAEFASAVAALKCTRVGGRTGIPNLNQTYEFLRQHSSQDWPH